MVLVCLVLAGLALVPIAQHSLETVTAAAARERQLQLHWGAVSCQRTLHGEAKTLFEELDKKTLSKKSARDSQRDVQLPRELTLTVRLGRLPFRLTLADEDAKANLNSLYHFGGPQASQRFVTQQMRSIYRLPVRLRPQTPQVDPGKAIEAGEPLPIAFSSWGQVFDLPHAQALVPGPLPLQQSTPMVTCWGNGRLNIRRAADEIAIGVCRPVVTDGATRRMLRTLRDDPLRQLNHVIEQLGVDKEKQTLLSALLTEQSACYSLWIGVFTDNVRWQQLSISERDKDGVVRTFGFVF
jgi:hypothetical protein